MNLTTLLTGQEQLKWIIGLAWYETLSVVLSAVLVRAWISPRYQVQNPILNKIKNVDLLHHYRILGRCCSVK